MALEDIVYFADNSFILLPKDSLETRSPFTHLCELPNPLQRDDLWPPRDASSKNTKYSLLYQNTRKLQMNISRA